MRTTLRWPLAVSLTTGLVCALAVIGAHGPLRVVATLFFLLVCTGMAFVPLLSIRSSAVELATGVAVSLALDTVVATAIVYFGRLSMTSGLSALAALSLVGCAAQTWRSRCS